MAKRYDVPEDGIITFPSSYNRLNGQPLDVTTVWYDIPDDPESEESERRAAYDRAVEYASTNKAYAGQIISVVDDVEGTCKAYIINQNGELIELGGGSNLTAIDTLIGSGIID